MKTARFNRARRAMQTVRESWLRLSIVVAGLLCSTLALADDPSLGGGDLGQVAQKLQGEASSWKNFLWTGSQVAGIVIAIAGINMWVKAAKHEDGRHSHGRAIMITVIGSLLFFLPTFMGVGASSILDS